MKNLKFFVLACAALLVIATAAQAGAIMTGDDANNATSTSFNSDVQTKWNPAGAPTAGNTYSTGGWLMRTPQNTGNYTFLGDQLTVGGPSPHYPFLTNGAINNNSLIYKTNGPAANTISVNDLILDAGYIRDGMGSGDTWHLTGNITVTNNGGGFAAQCACYIDSIIKGSGNLYVADNGSGEAVRTINITSGSNTYNGTIKLLSTHTTNPNNYSRITFTSGSLMNFDINAPGVNNSIYGTGTAEFDGIFNFDLTGAGTNFGDTWKIVTTTAMSFGSTFNVNGFTDIGGDRWVGFANGVHYLFDEGTGWLLIDVPEPATIVMILTGVLGMGMFWLRKRS